MERGDFRVANARPGRRRRLEQLGVQAGCFFGIATFSHRWEWRFGDQASFTLRQTPLEAAPAGPPLLCQARHESAMWSERLACAACLPRQGKGLEVRGAE